jgi:hypothetical protein
MLPQNQAMGNIRVTFRDQMGALKLRPGNESRDGGAWAADDFDVIDIETGATVGRIYARTSSGTNSQDWWWGLAFPFTLNAPRPFYGLAENKEAAKANFRDCWSRIEKSSAL